MGLGDIVKVIVTGDSEGAKRALKGAQSEAKKTGGAFGKMGLSAASGLAGLATAGAIVVDAVKSAFSYEDALTKLNKTLDDAGLHHQAYAKSIQDTIDANIVFGTKEDDTLALLNQGVVATGSMTKATDLLAEAQDIHAGSTLDLATAYTAALKGSEGNIKALKAMGIDIPVVASSAQKVKVAFEAWGKAQQKLKDDQEAVRKGILKGKAERDTLKSDLDTLAVKEQNYNDVASSGAIVTATLKKKYAGQAASQASTTEGQIRDEIALWDQLKMHVGEDMLGVVAAVQRGAVRLKGIFQNLDADITSNPVVDWLFGFTPGSAKEGNTILGIPRDKNGKPINQGAPIDNGPGVSQIGAPGAKRGKTAPNTSVTPTGADLLYTAWQKQQHDADVAKVMKAIAARPNVTINMHAQPTPSMTKSVIDRHAKRNGRNNLRTFRKF